MLPEVRGYIVLFSCVVHSDTEDEVKSHSDHPEPQHLRSQDTLLQQRAGGSAADHSQAGGGDDQPGLGALGEGEDIPGKESFQKVRSCGTAGNPPPHSVWRTGPELQVQCGIPGGPRTL